MPKRRRKYWYYFYHSECCLCGACRDYKERRYSRKPKDVNKRHESGPTWACDKHFM